MRSSIPFAAHRSISWRRVTARRRDVVGARDGRALERGAGGVLVAEHERYFCFGRQLPIRVPSSDDGLRGEERTCSFGESARVRVVTREHPQRCCVDARERPAVAIRGGLIEVGGMRGEPRSFRACRRQGAVLHDSGDERVGILPQTIRDAAV